MRARSEAGLSRLPVTEEIAGSNPVGPATKQVHHLVDFFRGMRPYWFELVSERKRPRPISGRARSTQT